MTMMMMTLTWMKTMMMMTTMMKLKCQPRIQEQDKLDRMSLMTVIMIFKYLRQLKPRFSRTLQQQDFDHKTAVIILFSEGRVTMITWKQFYLFLVKTTFGRYFVLVELTHGGNSNQYPQCFHAYLFLVKDPKKLLLFRVF